MLRFAPVASLLRLPTLGYTFVSPFRSVRYRAGVLRCAPFASVLRFAPVASFAPAHVALRAAFGRLPSQRPLACVQVCLFHPLSAYPGESFSGLQLMCLMYAGFKRIAPEQDTGMDLKEPWITALGLFTVGK